VSVPTIEFFVVWKSGGLVLIFESLILEFVTRPREKVGASLPEIPGMNELRTVIKKDKKKAARPGKAWGVR
jgi:hypothetical protein